MAFNTTGTVGTSGQWRHDGAVNTAIVGSARNGKRHIVGGVDMANGGIYSPGILLLDSINSAGVTSQYGLFINDTTGAVKFLSNIASLPATNAAFNTASANNITFDGVTITTSGLTITAGGLTVTAGNTSLGGTVSSYNGTATAGRGISTVWARVGLTVQAASIATTNLLATVGVGEYRVSYYFVLTQAATTSSSLTFTVGWNDGAAQTQSGAALATNTLNAFQQGSFFIRSAAAQNITYATTYASTGATPMQYSLYVILEAL